MNSNVIELLEKCAWSRNVDDFLKLLEFHSLIITSKSLVFDGCISPQYVQMVLQSKNSGEELAIFVPFGIDFKKPQTIEDFF